MRACVLVMVSALGGCGGIDGSASAGGPKAGTEQSAIAGDASADAPGWCAPLLPYQLGCHVDPAEACAARCVGFPAATCTTICCNTSDQ